MTSSLEFILRGAGEAARLVGRSLITPATRKDFIGQLGWVLPDGVADVDLSGLAVTPVLDKLDVLLSSTEEERQDPFIIGGRIADLADALRDFVSSATAVVSAFSTFPQDYLTKTQIISEFPKRLIRLMLVRRLRETLPTVFALLQLAGLIEVETIDQPNAALFESRHQRFHVHFERLGTIFSGDKSWAEEVYKWGTPTPNLHALVSNIGEAIAALGVNASDLPLPQQVEELILQRPVPEAATDPLNMVVSQIFRAIAPDTGQAGLSVVGLRPSTPGATDGGLGLTPYLFGSSEIAFPLYLSEHNNWEFFLFVEGQLLAGGVLLAVRAKQPIKVESNIFDPATRGEVLSGSLGAGIRINRPDGRVPIISLEGGSVLEAGKVVFRTGAELGPNGGGAFGEIEFIDGRLAIGLGSSDGFLSNLFGGKSPEALFDVGLQFSQTGGLRFKGAGSLQISLPVNIEIGPITLSAVTLGLTADTNAALVELSVNATGKLGPVTAAVERIGLGSTIEFHDGNLGPVELGLRFKPPTGVGISVKAGPVSGGGFVSFDEPNGRYFGALELSVYSVAVKAFGIIETKFPDGHEGFSFLIIISAEFTPVQLGFGFTLNGVGGMVGINRTIDTDALLAAVRRGTLDHVLFPEDPVKNAPSLVQALGAIFPAAEGHYVFGPLAKIGWGTPTLVEARIGLVIELPGPRLLVLGTVRAALPKPDAPLVLLNLDVAGVLDFPKKYFSLDASLHDSKVGEFPITGDMAMRLTWGNNPNFAFAIGGFNPHFTPPGNFPKLRPATVDLGVQGNPSITLSGYLALTSNTAQTGAKLEARVSKGGANLYGFLGFDAIFVFSPFSFMGDVEGGVDVNFHGYGFSLHFHGHVQGPTPWKLDGQVCVSILFWDACVGFSVTLGGEQRVSLPGLDPWLGSPAGERSLAKQEVPGLSQALETTANWTGGLPTGSFAVVTLIEAPPEAQTPVDPLGSATFRQKAAPLGIDVTRFAGTKPSVARNFKVESVTIGQEGHGQTTVTNLPVEKDFFAPAQYIEMKDADKLSHPSFDLMDAGFTVSSNVIDSGTAVIHPFTYDTVLFSATAAPVTSEEQYDPTNTHVAAVAGRSAAAFGGIRATGLTRFIDLPFFARARLVNETYGVTNIGTLGGVSGFPVGVSKSAALSALFAAKASNPLATRTLQVTPSYNFRPA